MHIFEDMFSVCSYMEFHFESVEEAESVKKSLAETLTGVKVSNQNPGQDYCKCNPLTYLIFTTDITEGHDIVWENITSLVK